MKKEKVILLIVAVVLMISSLIIYYEFGQGQVNVIMSNEKVGEFDFSDYEEYVKQFPSDERIKSDLELKELKAEAISILEKVYGKDVNSETKKYKVYYDEENKVWLVTGTLPKDMDGGVPYILIRKSGEVLAVWHDK